MKKLLAAVLSVLMILALSGCGSNDGNDSPLFVAEIISDPVYDGDIKYDPITKIYTVTQGNTGSVLAGVDLFNNVEYRSFLAFNLVGAVPGDAIIRSAWLDIYVNSVDTQFPLDTIPLRIDLVSFEPQLPILVGSDFDSNQQPALASITVNPPISRADANQPVSVDVTPLMAEAQLIGLKYFQVRIMENLGIVDPGIVEINDTTGADRSVYAPLLTVTYY